MYVQSETKLTLKLTLFSLQVIFTCSWHWWRYEVVSRIGTRRRRKGLGCSELIVRATLPASQTGTQPCSALCVGRERGGREGKRGFIIMSKVSLQLNTLCTYIVHYSPTIFILPDHPHCPSWYTHSPAGTGRVAFIGGKAQIG